MTEHGAVTTCPEFMTSPNEKGWTTGGTKQKASITRINKFCTNNVKEDRVIRGACFICRRTSIVAAVTVQGTGDI